MWKVKMLKLLFSKEKVQFSVFLLHFLTIFEQWEFLNYIVFLFRYHFRFAEPKSLISKCKIFGSFFPMYKPTMYHSISIPDICKLK